MLHIFICVCDEYKILIYEDRSEKRETVRNDDRSIESEWDKKERNVERERERERE